MGSGIKRDPKREYQKALGIRLSITTFIVTQLCAAVTESLLANMPQCLAQHLCDEEMTQSGGSYWAETGQPFPGFPSATEEASESRGPLPGSSWEQAFREAPNSSGKWSDLKPRLTGWLAARLSYQRCLPHSPQMEVVRGPSSGAGLPEGAGCACLGLCLLCRLTPPRADG